ncbi:indole dioxygenase [Pseudonocardia spinosispora]|uniref:indole dioxygenase n=1 Tax=Pseudonocardia spinosispora TaxID=103441 RepID=UPI0003FBEE3A|nr:indole dioxygenase [Pseudonocardia spinosispora]
MARAAALVPELDKRADTARELGRLTDESVALIREAGLVTSLAPGGARAPLGTFVRVLEELARGCGSTSWVCGIYAASLYMLSSFDDEAQDEVYSTSATPTVLAAFQPDGMAAPVDGGYRLSGTWRFCSGQHHADWALLSSISPTVGPAQFLVPRADWMSAEDWQVNGLSGTGSASLSVREAFVPSHRVLPVGAPSRSALLADDPYFAMPFIPLFVTGAIGTPLGLGRAALEQFTSRVTRRGITYTAYERQAEAAVTHLAMDAATMKLDQARFHAERAVATVAEVSADPGDVAARVRCRADAAWATRLCREVVRTVADGSGASALRRTDPLSRVSADIEALSVHSFLLHSTNAELHGRVLCGMDPGVPFL